MLIKWIVCQVEPDQREAFSRAQAGWGRLQEITGFFGQFGGWNRHREGEACVVGLWADDAAYQRFMREVHDEIVQENGQEKVYTTCHTAMFETVLPITGRDADLVESLKSIDDSEIPCLRVADCTVKPDCVDHFITMQKEVWNPGMAGAGGFFGGFLSQSRVEANRFLVTALWESESAHRAYTERYLPEFRLQSEVEKDLESIEGKICPLESPWTLT